MNPTNQPLRPIDAAAVQRAHSEQAEALRNFYNRDISLLSEDEVRDFMSRHQGAAVQAVQPAAAVVAADPNQPTKVVPTPGNGNIPTTRKERAA